MERQNGLQEIDLVKITQTFIQNKSTVLKIVLVFLLFGLFIAVFTPKEYTASTVFVPQGTDGKKIGGNLGGLAALAGINIGSGAGESGIPINLYPEILRSVPFQKELIKTPLTIKGENEKTTFEGYYKEYYKPGLISNIKKYTIGLPSLIFSSNKSNENKLEPYQNSDTIYHVSATERNLFDKLNNQISLSVDANDNFVTIAAKMPNPILSAELAYQTEKLLEKYIIDYKIEKSASKLSFIKKRYEEKFKDFKSKQQRLASFQDRNRYSTSARSQARLSSLQSEFDLAFNVFNGLAQQLETQQIQVKEDTPIFTIIKPVSIPTEKSAPHRLSIIFIWLFFGLLVSIGFVFGREFYQNYQNNLSKN